MRFTIACLAAALGASVMVTACGVTGRPGAGPAASSSLASGTAIGDQQMTGTPAPAVPGTVGPDCASLPASGTGSIRGMAADPVTTAASHNPLLSELAHAVQVAGLRATFDAARPITIFAPDNAAFDAFGATNVETLLARKHDLVDVLRYHVVNGRVTPAELASGKPLTSLLGTKIVPALADGQYDIDNASVVCGNFRTASATVYIVDKLLIPVTG